MKEFSSFCILRKTSPEYIKSTLFKNVKENIDTVSKVHL